MTSIADEIISYLGISKEKIEHSDYSLSDEILQFYGANSLSDGDVLHYGIKRRSGRYPYGSGKEPYQHGRDFLGRIEELKKSGFTYTDEDGKTYSGETAIYKSMGLTSGEYRIQKSWANYERRLLEVETAKALRADGLNVSEIGRRMGKNESSIRSLLDNGAEGRMKECMNTVDFLRKEIDEKGMIDVGAGVEYELNISRERLNTALDYLVKADGCNVYEGRISQLTNNNQHTTQKVLTLPGIEHKEIYNLENVKTLRNYISRDGGETYEKKFYYPESLDSKRLKVLLADEIGPDGEPGVAKDGIIQLRRGVPDLSLGESKYSQVRILVDGNKYLKGMAVYSDNMPDGVDVIFNSNKSKVEDAFKEIKNDPDNPFGSLIKDADQGGQYWYDADTGKRCSANDASVKNKKLGLINKRADEGDWTEWADTLPSQFLSKQAIPMAKKQLNLAKIDKLAEFDDICSLENPTIKKHFLEKFADNCDSAAVHLKAAALPGQKYHVIVPINTLKDTEIYAPGYENGTKLALVRYPHGGTFEIPILTVNNKNKNGKMIIGHDSIDAVGINKNVADRLSGADFDGDTVMCIPTHDPGNKVKITSRDELEGLKGFDPRLTYGTEKVVGSDGKEHYYRKGQEVKIMKNSDLEMGKISNLITDMTLTGLATNDELARAVRHSMVVIDAKKHKLDYKASEIENNIAGLKAKYQPKYDDDGNVIGAGGASTIVSKAKGVSYVLKRQGSYNINTPGKEWYDPTKPEGAKIWKLADDRFQPDKKKDKETGLTTVVTADGKKITYDAKNKEEYAKYNPVLRVNGEIVSTSKYKAYNVTDKDVVTFTNADGTITYKMNSRKQQSTNMADTDDAHTLVSKDKHPMEILYADYANDMKALGNQARTTLVNTGKIAYNAAANKQYKDEVKSLEDKLDNALVNAPRMREALRRANVDVKNKLAADPDMSKEDIKKTKQRAVSKAREEVGAVSRRNRNIEITDKEWEAIQAGAISETQLKKILNNTDIDKLRERAMPKTTTTVSPAKINRIKAMSKSNYTIDQIAKQMGLSPSTVSKYLKGAK